MICLLSLDELQRRLQSLAESNLWARVFALALGIETNNFEAKGLEVSSYSNRRGVKSSLYLFARKVDDQTVETRYKRKQELIGELIKIYRANNWVFGVHVSDRSQTSHIIYFDLPTGEHISWHYSPCEELPVYLKQWDGKRNQIFAKLESAIEALFPEINAVERAAHQAAEEKRLAANARTREQYAAKRAAWRSQYLSEKELKARGWTESKLAGLGEPDDWERKGWCYYGLYKIEKITAIEGGQAK